MKIAVMSDSHDRWDYLQQAIMIANNKGAEKLLFAGDFISPPGISVIGQFGGEVIMVWGNNDGEKIGLLEKAKENQVVNITGDIYEDKIGEINVYMNHYPRSAEIAAKSKLYNLVIHGHTHQWRVEIINGITLLNPGEIQGSRGDVTFALVETETLEIEKVFVEQK